MKNSGLSTASVFTPCGVGLYFYSPSQDGFHYCRYRVFVILAPIWLALAVCKPLAAVSVAQDNVYCLLFHNISNALMIAALSAPSRVELQSANWEVS